MNITPKPITADTHRLEDRSPIGTRYTDGTATYTLVAYEFQRGTPGAALPVLLEDDELETPRTQYDFIADGSVSLEYPQEVLNRGDILEVAPDDPEKAARARAAALRRYNEPARDTRDLSWVLAFEDLNTEEEVKAFRRWMEAELELRKAEAALARAAADRAVTLERLVNLTGSQEKAGRTVGKNQSSVSRALRLRRTV